MVNQASIEEIVNFIKVSKHPVTKRQVAKHMAKFDLELSLAYETVSKEMDRLVKQDRIIKLQEDWKRGRGQHFVINPKSDFNQISDLVSRISDDLKLHLSNDPTKIKSVAGAIDAYDKTWAPSMKSLNKMLDGQLLRTYSAVHSDEDALKLYRIIMKCRKELSDNDYRISRHINLLKQDEKYDASKREAYERTSKKEKEKSS